MATKKALRISDELDAALRETKKAIMVFNGVDVSMNDLMIISLSRGAEAFLKELTIPMRVEELKDNYDDGLKEYIDGVMKWLRDITYGVQREEYTEEWNNRMYKESDQYDGEDNE